MIQSKKVTINVLRENSWLQVNLSVIFQTMSYSSTDNYCRWMTDVTTESGIDPGVKVEREDVR